MHLQLTDDEAHLLREVLRSYLKELRGEIIDTDNVDYKRSLRRERGQLESIAGRLDATPDGGEVTVTRVVRVSTVWT